MLKRKIMQLILITIIVIGSLTGCSNVDGTKEENTFDIYEDIISSEYRGSDIDSALRYPALFKDKKFTFSGTVLDSKTSDDGIQMVTLELDSQDTYTDEGMYESGTIVSLQYNVDSFDGERLVKDDRIAISGRFKDIKNDFNYGDIAEFDVLDTTNIMDYLSSLALADYFKSIAVDLKTLGLKIEEFSDYKEFEKIVGKNNETVYVNDITLVSVFSTSSGVYWLLDFNLLEPEGYGMQLYSGEKDDTGEIEFQYKQNLYISSFEF